MRVSKPRVVFFELLGTGVEVFFRVIAFMVFLTTPVVAGSSERSTIDLIFELGESRLELANYILRSSADFVAENPEISDRQGYLGLKGILNDSEQFRSILAIDENGQLMFDSYNWIPFLGGADLSARTYFQETTNKQGKGLSIGGIVVGKQSGEVFIPLTMPVPNVSGRNQKIVVLTALPSAFLPEQDFCAFCGVSMVLDSNVIASTRPMSDVNEAVISKLHFDGQYGATNLKVRGMDVAVHWRKSSATSVVYLYYRATPIGAE
jgi:hypothetical protein